MRARWSDSAGSVAGQTACQKRMSGEFGRDTHDYFNFIWCSQPYFDFISGSDHRSILPSASGSCC